jgi:hypothetical protein
MTHFLVRRWYWVGRQFLFGKHFLIITTTTLMVLLKCILPSQAQQQMYNPIPLSCDRELADRLSDRDIPTGEGGFARDYTVTLDAGEEVSVDLNSDDFDAILMLIADDGSPIAENDDGPDGSTNALLFARITESGKYIVRVKAFGDTGSGKFTLKLTRLRKLDKCEIPNNNLTKPTSTKRYK